MAFRGLVSIVKLIVSFIVLFCASIFVFAQVERDSLRAVPAIVVDGDLADWSGHPYAVWGCDRPSENELAALAYSGWSADGIAVAFRVYTQTAGLGSDETIDLFIDTRPFSARMDIYTPGVFHFVIRPEQTADGTVHIAQVDHHGREVKNSACLSTRGAVRSLPDGWSAEYVLPWSAIGVTLPEQGAWIAFSARLSCPKSQVSAERNSIGAASVDRKNSLENTPISFSPVRISASATQPEPISYRVEEVLFQGEPWIEVEVVVPTEAMNLAKCTLVLTGLAAGVEERLSFENSLSGRFWVAHDRLPLSSVPREGATLPIGLKIADGRWKREVSVAIPVAARTRELDRMLPDRLIKKLPPSEQAMASLLKECAKESITLVSSAPDGERPPQKAFRAVFTPTLYDEKINLYAKLAAEFIAGKKIGPSFPYRAWQSAIDSAWLPIKVVYPWNFDPTRVYPAQIVIYGLSRTRTRTQFMENDLIALTQGQYNAYTGDGISIVLYGRGNSFLQLGEEELKYVFNTLLPSLPVDPHRLSIYGGSYGAAVALELVLRWPDRFAWVYCRAGSFDHLLSTKDASILSDRLKNLTNTAVYLTAGGQDTEVARSNKLLYDMLRSYGIACNYQEWPNTAHVFLPEQASPDIMAHTIPDLPSHIDFSTITLGAATSFWLTIDRIQEVEPTAQIQGDLGDSNKVVITTKNLAAFTIHFGKFSAAHFPLRVVIDGEQITELVKKPASPDIGFVLSNGIWMQPVSGATVPGSLVKRSGLCGPSREVEKSRMLVVYGTKDSTRKRALRDRAFEVVRTRVGTDIDQWGGGHFTIKSDVEVTPAEIAANNLWLIGSPSENAVVASLAKNLPIILGEHGLDVGTVHLDLPNMLLSYIYPDSSREHYLYVEMGRSLLAYKGNVLAAPESDLCVEEVRENGSSIVLSSLFGGNWEILER